MPVKEEEEEDEELYAFELLVLRPGRLAGGERSRSTR